MAGIFISCFPIFPPNMSGISALGLRSTFPRIRPPPLGNPGYGPASWWNERIHVRGKTRTSIACDQSHPIDARPSHRFGWTCASGLSHFDHLTAVWDSQNRKNRDVKNQVFQIVFLKSDINLEDFICHKECFFRGIYDVFFCH